MLFKCRLPPTQRVCLRVGQSALAQQPRAHGDGCTLCPCGGTVSVPVPIGTRKQLPPSPVSPRPGSRGDGHAGTRVQKESITAGPRSAPLPRSSPSAERAHVHATVGSSCRPGTRVCVGTRNLLPAWQSFPNVGTRAFGSGTVSVVPRRRSWRTSSCLSRGWL